MKRFNQELETIQSQIRQKAKIASALKTLKGQLDSLQKEESHLREIRIQEEKDVERVSGGTLSAFIQYILGNQQQRIDQEEAEAYAAAVKHDSVSAQLASVQEDIQAYEEKLRYIGDCESRYKVLLIEKSEALKVAQPIKGAEICALEERIGYIKGQIKEVAEAYSAGSEAVGLLGELYQALNSAENWGVVDLFGGGWVSGAMKHSHLDEAQSQVNRLQTLIRRYTTELADIQIEHNLQIKTGSFLTFADFFFDGLFADYAVLDHITKSLDQIYEIKSKVNDMQGRLLATKQELSTQLQQKEQELEQLVSDAVM